MILDARSDRETVENALEALGAQVSWPAGAPDRTKPITLPDSEIDDEEAYEHLPSHWLRTDEWWGPPSDRDVGDFVAALLRGDREVALAIVGRVFATADTQWAAERLLQPLRSVA